MENARAFLSARGHTTVMTREPGGTPLGDGIRALLLDPRYRDMDAASELLLYGADHSRHVREVIRPALSRGDIVLCDRFLDSTIAYQGYGRGLDFSLIETVNAVATGGLLPDLTFLLDIEENLALERILQNRGGGTDRMEAENAAFFRRVRGGFLALAAQDPQRIRVIPAGGEREEIAARIGGHLKEVCGE